MGLAERLRENNEVIWHWDIPGRETLLQAREAKVYLASANGVSETGELVNIDGTGNRVSQTLYGPEKIYFIVGSNKIEPDLARAMERAKNVAAPKNARRLGSATPCAAKGDRCYDCSLSLIHIYKINAYMTLYTALVTVCKAAAPMVPFMTEDIYQNLVRKIDKDAPESIHLCDFPAADENCIDKELESRMDEVLKIVVFGRAARNTANIKNRQPIGKMFVKAEKALPEFYQEIIEDELNVKEVIFTSDVRDFTSYSFKPQLKTVGPKYGKQLGSIKKALAEIDGNKAMDTLNESGSLTFDFDRCV